MLQFDFIQEKIAKSQCITENTGLKRLQKTRIDHNTADDREIKLFFVKFHIIGHIIAIVVHVEFLVGGVVV